MSVDKGRERERIGAVRLTIRALDAMRDIDLALERHGTIKAVGASAARGTLRSLTSRPRC
jgi:hypothetical protein